MQNFEDVKAMDKVVVVGYFASDDKTSNNTFHAVAEALRDDFLFSATSDPEMAAAANVKHPAVILYKDFDGGKELFSGKFAEEDITNFVKVYSMPLVGEIGPDTYNSYMGVSLPRIRIIRAQQDNVARTIMLMLLLIEWPSTRLPVCRNS